MEYGLTTSYGSQTTEDPALVTAHTVQLASLTADHALSLPSEEQGRRRQS